MDSSSDLNKTACGGVNGKRYLGVPMLVTTIDQVIKAANHSRSGWLLPWLRLLNEENFRNKRKADSFSVKIVNELLKNGLWNTTWWEIVDSYPTIDANDEAFREVRIYENRVNKVMISPLWGVVTNDGDAR